MKNTVINCTEGGAKIQGCDQLLLKDVIDKYCKKDINKSKFNKLLSHADDADKLIEKVVPLLKNDIKNLTEIIKESKKGLKANKELKELIKKDSYKKLLPAKKERKFQKVIKDLSKNETNDITDLFYKKIIKSLKDSKLKTVVILSYENHKASFKAQIASAKNPLVNVAIYGASRQIQGRDLKVSSNIIDFLKNRKNALIRIKRNTLILETAKNAALSLKKSYNKTYELLKEYNKTKDNNLLINNEIEEINLDDAESYFEAGNWAHPLLDAKAILDIANCKDYSMSQKIYDKIINNPQKIYDKAIKMKHVAIKKAKKYEKENIDHLRKLLKYNVLLTEAKKIGREQNKYKEALGLLKKAAELMPKETEARWGLATAYHHSEKIEESLKEYKNLIKDFPDNHLFKFEYGQVLLTNKKIKEGLAQISEVMKETNEYDSFFAHLAHFYKLLKMPEEELSSYGAYLKKFPFDYKIWHKKADCLESLGRNKLAEKARNKALEIKPI